MTMADWREPCPSPDREEIVEGRQAPRLSWPARPRADGAWSIDVRAARPSAFAIAACAVSARRLAGVAMDGARLRRECRAKGEARPAASIACAIRFVRTWPSVAPARAIQDLAGHQDLTATQRYMHLSPAAIEGAIRVPRGIATVERGPKRSPAWRYFGDGGR
jgi:hypothetical protein